MVRLITLTKNNIRFYQSVCAKFFKCRRCGKEDFKVGDRIYKAGGGRNHTHLKYFCEDHFFAEPRRIHE